jgi:hypothetical protein
MYIDDRMEALLSVRKAKILETMARHLADPERNMMCCAAFGRGRRAELTQRFGIGAMTQKAAAADVAPMMLVMAHMAMEPSHLMRSTFLEARRSRVRRASQSALTATRANAYDRDGRAAFGPDMKGGR